MFINRRRNEINLKLVYYGPALSGKTTNLQQLYACTPAPHRSELMSVNTEGDRTLFFDFLQVAAGSVLGMTPKFKLYTVPGQSYYQASRRLVLQGVDGIVFVADSAPARMLANMISWRSMLEHLVSYGIAPATFPIVLQVNKRDLPNATHAAFLKARLGAKHVPMVEAVAATGVGVTSTLKLIVQSVMKQNYAHLTQEAKAVPARTVPAARLPLPLPRAAAL